MSFAELFLRLACSLVGWLVVYAYGLWMAILPDIVCNQGGSDPLLVVFIFSLLALAFVPLLGLGLAVPGAGPALRWFAVPVLVIVPLGLYVSLPFLLEVSMAGMTPCGESAPAATWQRLWAPAQIVLLAALARLAWRSLARRGKEAGV